MKNFKRKSDNYKKSMLMPLITFVLLIIILFIGIQKFEGILKEQNLLLTEQAVQKSIVQCYANEGFYPATLEYLEDNYNLTIDYDSYYVYYDCIASNLVPEVAVYERQKE